MKTKLWQACMKKNVIASWLLYLKLVIKLVSKDFNAFYCIIFRYNTVTMTFKKNKKYLD